MYFRAEKLDLPPWWLGGPDNLVGFLGKRWPRVSSPLHPLPEEKMTEITIRFRIIPRAPTGLDGPEDVIVLSLSGCSLQARMGNLSLFAALGRLKGEN